MWRDREVSQRLMGKDNPRYPMTFVIRPNSSLSWRGNIIVFLSVTAVCIIVVTPFAFLGYWPMLSFAGLEIAALAIALYLCARRSQRREVVTVNEDEIEVSRGRLDPERNFTFNRHWAAVRLQPPSAGRPGRLTVGSHGREVEVGAFLNDDERRELAKALRRAVSH